MEQISGTYGHTLAIAVDQFFAAVLFNRPDYTISAMCWAVSVGQDGPFKFNRAQQGALRLVGYGLEWANPGHLAEARYGDAVRAQSALTLLGPA